MANALEFIMNEKDEKKIDEFISSLEDIVIIPAASNMCYPDIINKLPKKNERLFWNKVYVARKCDIEKIKMVYVVSHGHFIIEDTYEAPVIEINRSMRSKYGNAILRYEPFYYKNGKVVDKEDEFKDVYRRLEEWISSSFKVIGI